MAFSQICGQGQPPVMQLTDDAGVIFPLQITDSDDDHAVINMAIESMDYDPGAEFMICIETDAPIVVQLARGNNFTITQAQATAYLGQWYPAKLKKVYKTGTTGTFSVGR